jgi:hypothetical protein
VAWVSFLEVQQGFLSTVRAGRSRDLGLFQSLLLGGHGGELCLNRGVCLLKFRMLDFERLS